MPTGQSLADLLSGTAGAPVNRTGLNTFVANSQAINGLRSAQTEDALIQASQAQEKMAAHDRIKDLLVENGAPASEAALARDFLVGSNNDDPVTALKALSMTKLGYGTPTSQVQGQQMHQGEVAPLRPVPNNFVVPTGQAPPDIQQSIQGAAQTAQTKALTGLDVARAEDEHARAKNAALQGATSLSPGAIDEAARVTMADPTKMSGYAGYGNSGAANRNAINNRRAEMLNEAGMTTDQMIAQRAVAKASTAGASQAAKQLQTLDAFTPLVKANSDRIMQLLDQLDASGGAGIDEPIINGFERMMGRKLNSDDLTELHSVFTSYQNEIARLLAAGPSMNGVISDHARGDIQGMAPETMSASGARRVLNRVNMEIDIRRQGAHSSLEEAANAQRPVVPSQPHNLPPAASGSTDDTGLPPGFHRLN